MRRRFRVVKRKFGQVRTYLRWGRAVLATLLILAFLFASPFFSCGHHIEVSGAEKTNSEEILSLVREKVSGRNIFLLRSSQLEKAIAERFLWLGGVVVRKRLPNRLRLEIYERTPTALVRSGGLLFLVDENGNVFSQAEEGGFNLPILEISQDGLSLGQVIENEGIRTHLRVLYLLHRESLVARDVKVQESEIAVSLKEGPPVLLDPDKDLEGQVATLAKLLRKYKIEGIALKKINFLFEKVVVEY